MYIYQLYFAAFFFFRMTINWHFVIFFLSDCLEIRDRDVDDSVFLSHYLYTHIFTSTRILSDSIVRAKLRACKLRLPSPSRIFIQPP